MNNDLKFTYDDVLIVPDYNDIERHDDDDGDESWMVSSVFGIDTGLNKVSVKNVDFTDTDTEN